jgi:hypothetical protein
MTKGELRATDLLRRYLRAIVTALAVFAWTISGAGYSSATAEPRSHSGAFATTVDYVSNFYPLWFTYYQTQIGTHNRLVGPERVTPVYKIVVLINVDTLYASTFLDLTAEPIILVVPPTPANYSVLILDPYGTVLQKTGLADNAPGTYALIGPDFGGKIPAG